MITDLKRLQKRLLIATGLGRTAEMEFGGAETGEYSHDTPGDSQRTTKTTGRLSSGSQRSPIDSLAVLPFFTSSTDPNAAYLGEGIPESLILNLSRLSKLRVMAWSTVARFRGREVDALEIGRELDVRAIFAGRMYNSRTTW